MRYILLSLLAFFIGFSVNGQTEENKEKHKFSHAVGMAAGATTGIGFSYEMGINKYRLQVTGIPVFNRQSAFYSVGIANKFILKELDSHTKVFSYVAAHYLKTVSQYDIYSNPCYYDSNGNYICPPLTPTKAITEYLNVGLGGGLDIKVISDFYLQLMVGYGLYSNNSVLTRGTVTGEAAFLLKLR